MSMCTLRAADRDTYAASPKGTVRALRTSFPTAPSGRDGGSLVKRAVVAPGQLGSRLPMPVDNLRCRCDGLGMARRVSGCYDLHGGVRATRACGHVEQGGGSRRTIVDPRSAQAASSQPPFLTLFSAAWYGIDVEVTRWPSCCTRGCVAACVGMVEGGTGIRVGCRGGVHLSEQRKGTVPA